MKRFGQNAGIWAVFLFLYLPIFVLIAYSFNAGKSRAIWEGFSLHWYRELFHNEVVLKSFRNTFLIAILSTAISTCIGTLGALGLYRSKGKIQARLLEANYLPILNPDIVIAVSLVALYNFLRLEFGYFTIIMSHVAFLTPYVLFSVLPRLAAMDPHLYEAAIDLGATPSQAFRRVILPEIRPGIASGALMAFTLSIDDFVVSFFTTGKGIQNISITVWSMARRGINPVINALSAVMFAIMVALVVGIRWRATRERRRQDEKIRDL